MFPMFSEKSPISRETSKTDFFSAEAINQSAIIERLKQVLSIKVRENLDLEIAHLKCCAVSMVLFVQNNRLDSKSF